MPISERPGRTRSVAFFIAICLAATAGAVGAQQAARTPVAAMYADDQKREASRASSFQQADLPATQAAAFPAALYLSAGDLERVFDRPEFRPDAAIVPTNTDLLITAAMPNTQRVLIDRVRKQPDVLKD